MMVVPRVLMRSIDTAKSPLDFFAEEAQFKVVAIPQCPNHIAHVTFEEGTGAAKLDFEDQGCIKICGVECQGISPAPPGGEGSRV